MRKVLGYSDGTRKFDVLREPFPANRESKVPAVPPGMSTKNSSQQSVALGTNIGLIVFRVGLYPPCLIVV